MSKEDSTSSRSTIAGWYDLFSRGARDWLRHNDKVRDAVRSHLPDAIAGGDVLSGGTKTVRVPVRMLEHYHFRLRAPDRQQGVGQGAARPGDTLGQPGGGPASGKGGGGRNDGGIEFLLEFKVDDIVDWLWEEMQLPNLRPRAGRAEQEDLVREGWDRRGARSRLDRRRSMRESIKRREVQPEGAPRFTDDDLRFRQLAKRDQPATQAVVFFLMDVSASMSDRDRQLAKSFFFWAVQGLRRQYRQLDTVFVAHTTDAWEFNEEEFFKVSGSGGTVTSAGLKKILEIIRERFDPGRYNVYMFYASDGDNASSDHADAQAALGEIATLANYAGYVEVATASQGRLNSECGTLFKELADGGNAAASFVISRFEDIWDAVRHFFQHQAAG